ncbi:Single-stranded DNA-binding protein [[Actinomadura] parvosata subsp. kistnae]|uniref:Single-stranded DNA-binding protein n=1 Tax=[Actinomadura] parvosata subsp. kistnae TaxID=1909395 RepID=A0A1V0AAQ4_9ACTN|nr:single-stranded DNA-binding protein [Nonomuraea sp. ATCC 55076]AQZ67253.1 single-stranded DNA-binding protein [Nonomuraea sp. ATCC 55076]SPL94530.1 Single-stranded DNA-binding protein [Actinomadura parvosata subsp. kistnae]
MSGDTTITIIGNLTGDPELRFTQSGVGVAGFTIASSARTYNKSIEKWEDGEVLFMRCSAWRDLADHVAESLTRGTRVIATGRLRQRTYETSDGDHRTVMEMTVDEIGPSLRFATAKSHKAARTGSNGHDGGAPADDPWASAAPSSDKPPF